MSENSWPPSAPPRRPTLAVVVLALTVVACVTGLVCHTTLRSRYWAYRIARAATPAERAVYLGALCEAGDSGRWGVAALLKDARADVRQYGVLVLQHQRGDWWRARLLDLLGDPAENVRSLAAAGLAIHGDERAIPALKSLYETGDTSMAASACLALERLGTAGAQTALDELARVPADAYRRAALIDALEGIGTPECVPGLLHLLADHRPCDLPSRATQAAHRAFESLAAAGYPALPTSEPAAGPGPRTVAERAARALANITGLDVPFSSEGPEEARAEAVQRWRTWLADRSASNPRP